MTLETIKKQIQGHDYEVGHFPAFYNYNLFIKFSSIVGVSLQEIFSALTDNSGEASSLMDLKINFGNVGKALHELVTSLYINDRDGSLMLEIMSQTMRDGRVINKVTFDEFYRGNMSEMIDALLLSIQVHFGGFVQKKFFGLVESVQVQKN